MLALALLTLAQGADLTLDLQVPGATEPTHLVLADVAPGPLPVLAVPAPDGSRYLFHVTLGLEEGRARYDMEVEQLKPGRKGQYTLEVVSRPRIVAPFGERAVLKQGARVPIAGTSPVQYQEYAMSIELFYDSDPAVLASAPEVPAALGRVVRITGRVDRLKLGDQVTSGDLSVLCPDFRVPDDQIGSQVTVEGRLEWTTDFAATTGPDGAISQGMAPGSRALVLRACALRP